KSDETIKKRFGKVMEFEIDNCDCATFIEEKKREATNSIKSYESMITDCRWLETQLEGLKRIFNIEKNDFKERRLDDFIQQLEKRRSDAINSKKREEDYLNTYNEWETKLNQQIKENEPK
ncbi:11638_t:CDS:1, partial [Ambispora leptoticha]